MAVEEKVMKVIGHLGRQENILLETESIITTCMKESVDIIHESGFALTED